MFCWKDALEYFTNLQENTSNGVAFKLSFRPTARSLVPLHSQIPILLTWGLWKANILKNNWNKRNWYISDLDRKLSGNSSNIIRIEILFLKYLSYDFFVKWNTCHIYIWFAVDYVHVYFFICIAFDFDFFLAFPLR